MFDFQGSQSQSSLALVASAQATEAGDFANDNGIVQQTKRKKKKKRRFFGGSFGQR